MTIQGYHRPSGSYKLSPQHRLLRLLRQLDEQDRRILSVLDDWRSIDWLVAQFDYPHSGIDREILVAAINGMKGRQLVEGRVRQGTWEVRRV